MASFLWSLLLTLLKEDDETKSAEKDFYVKNTFLQMITMVLILHYEAMGTKKMLEQVNEVVEIKMCLFISLLPIIFLLSERHKKSIPYDEEEEVGHDDEQEI